MNKVKFGFYSVPEGKRNCDRFTNREESVKAFLDEVCSHYDNDVYDPRTQCHGNCIQCVMGWLFDKEGEEK